MNILAVESSGMVAAVSVVRKDRVMGEFFLDNRRNHSQQLMPLIERLMDDLDMKLKDIHVFAASKGPGSFTGLRIGIAIVKGLAQATDKPVVGVPTLDGLAYNLWSRNGLICPIMDARREQVYTSVYRSRVGGEFDGSPDRIDEYMAIPVSELIEKLKMYDEPVMFNGDGVDTYWPIIKEELGEKAIRAPINLMVQRASSIALLAQNMAISGNVQSYVDLVPFYLRKSQAEQKFAAKG